MRLSSDFDRNNQLQAIIFNKEKIVCIFSISFSFIQSSLFLGKESWEQSIFHWKSLSMKKISDCTLNPQRTQNGSLYAELKINIVNVSRINDQVLPRRIQSKNISTSKHYLKQISSLTISLFIWSSKRFLTWRENLERCRHFIGDIQHAWKIIAILQLRLFLSFRNPRKTPHFI